jgi:hypothetical protein
MGTFSMNVEPTSKDMYIYPSSDVSLQLTAVGSTNHYDCINESYDVPDDSDYIYTTSISQVTDKFGFTDHTTQTGTINYIQLYARAKSHLYQQSSSGSYDLLLGVKNASTTTWRYYKSSEATYGSKNNLSTDYSLYSCIWTSNPSSQQPWSWTDIDNINGGILCSSPVVASFPVNKTFRPNSNVWTQLTGLGDNNYACVDEEEGDSESTMVYGGYGWLYDLYGLPDHTTETGVITNVTFFYNWKKWVGTSLGKGQYFFKIAGSASYTGGDTTLTTDWVLTSFDFASNPSTGLAWTWSDIDYLQMGEGLYASFGHETDCTQCYAIVYYLYAVSPEIRTSNMYMKINYTPSTTTYYLNKPSSYSFSNNRELKKINFWNGERKTYDLQRASKTLDMSGIEYNTSTSEATARMNNMIILKDEGSTITISGFTDENINTTWLIRDFKYSRDENNPYIFNWNLNLEKA